MYLELREPSCARAWGRGREGPRGGLQVRAIGRGGRGRKQIKDKTN